MILTFWREKSATISWHQNKTQEDGQPDATLLESSLVTNTPCSRTSCFSCIYSESMVYVVGTSKTGVVSKTGTNAPVSTGKVNENDVHPEEASIKVRRRPEVPRCERAVTGKHADPTERWTPRKETSKLKFRKQNRVSMKGRSVTNIFHWRKSPGQDK